MSATILVGDVRNRLREIPKGSVQTVVTSPPYWGLRDYGHDGQIGLEQTPEQYVAEMVEVFGEVRRVLADDGTLWLNLGDTYAKDKQIAGIPWRVAFALQEDGWRLRQDIIWAKPNVMPESVTDRCTKAHEYIFLLTKQPKYYYNNAAIKEPIAESSKARASYGWDSDRPSTKNASSGGGGIHVTEMGSRFVNPEGRNKRSWWTVVPKPFRGAHFAVMPEALVEPCILAGSSAGNTVLDPFSGSGTVGVVALRHGRKYVGCELNPEYADLSRKRICDDQPLMNTVEVR
jgi:DNA modification methylase